MNNKYWPLYGLVLRTPRLELRFPSEDELGALAEVAATGVNRPGQRTFLTPWPDLPPEQRGLFVVQNHWGCKAEWATTNWVLNLGVFAEGMPIGMVSLRGKEFSILREVTTGSWLGLEFQGKGYGTEARTALLHFAFEHLGAVAARTEVFQDNASSQGVSRKLGYQPDGISRDVLDGQVVVSDRLRLTHDHWLRVPHVPVTVLGLEQCKAYFLGEDVT
ncbi:GNAT family N-acetyltransferase [Deinococcus ficus]|uniref:N-acetyltransferase n=1 Tax=Deinococcus ficus TaxID=317577 RepID=A0A221T351_9DEIO|nr:GNAT family N-acetyltransferase [Deinococcus ficus]ASN83357.1 N-acetyltransferase [Deinococcus ficus]